jgi:hypothetical protein
MKARNVRHYPVWSKLMKRHLILATVCLLSLNAAIAGAAVIYDGSGLPSSVGYTYGGFSGLFSPDSPSPGILHQNELIAEGGSWVLDPLTFEATATRASGWTFETRLHTITNTGFTDDFGGHLVVSDDVGGFAFTLHPGSLHIYHADFGTYPSPLASVFFPVGFHTLRIVVAPGATTGDIYVDDFVTPVATLSAMVPHPGAPTIRFGDGTSGGGAHINWDYVTLVPEPQSIALMGLGLAAIGGVAMRRRKGAGGKASSPLFAGNVKPGRS